MPPHLVTPLPFHPDLSSFQTHRKTVESLDFYGRYETLLRTQVERKKSRLYAKQARQANQVN